MDGETQPLAAHVRFRAHEGRGEELVSLLRTAAGSMGEVDGCQLYLVTSAVEEPDTVYVTEVWRSAAAHEASLQAEGARELITQALPLLDGAPERTALVPRANWGLDA